MLRLGKALAAPLAPTAFVILVVYALSATREYGVPIALAVLLWFLINGIAEALRRAPGIGPRLPRRVAQTVAATVMAGVVLGSAQIVGANLAELAGGLSVPDSPLMEHARGLTAWLGLEIELTREALLERIPLETLIGGALSAVGGLLGTAGLVFLFALFLLVDERFYDAKLRALVPDPRRRAELRATLSDIARQTRAYLWLMTLISAGVGAITAAACWAAGVQGAGFWGFLAFALNFIPTIGSILGVAAPGIFALLTLGDPVALVGLLTVLALTQFLAGEIVVPRVMGDRLNLSTFVIMLVLVGWGAIWGPTGMFLAVPITVILVMVAGRFEATRPLAILLSKTGEAPRIVPPPEAPEEAPRS